jgi:hypothetical protein
MCDLSAQLRKSIAGKRNSTINTEIPQENMCGGIVTPFTHQGEPQWSLRGSHAVVQTRHVLFRTHH